jgi:hypothetical protein
VRSTGAPRREARKRAARATIGQPYPGTAYTARDVTRARLGALAVGFALGFALGFWIFL